MAFMSLAQQRMVASQITRRFSHRRDEIPAVRQDVIDTVAAIDEEYDQRSVNFNGAFTLPLRQGFSASEKAEIISMVLDGIKGAV